MKVLLLVFGILLAVPTHGAIIADHLAVADFDGIPESTFQDIRDKYKIFYGHTSHGSQVVTGIGMLENENASLYGSPLFHEILDDLGGLGDTTWVAPTRSWLDANPDYNVVMWSWCGGMSDNTEVGVGIYLEAMNQLEQDYPGVSFIYMTGHLDGTGPDGVLYRNNNLVRDYCLANDKILFDFADIESWDPDGTYYPDETDACNWCETWCSSRSCPTCTLCAHSHCFNCYLKGKGFWWMMAKIDGIVPVEKTTFGGLKSLYR